MTKDSFEAPFFFSKSCQLKQYNHMYNVQINHSVLDDCIILHCLFHGIKKSVEAKARTINLSSLSSSRNLSATQTHAFNASSASSSSSSSEKGSHARHRAARKIAKRQQQQQQQQQQQLRRMVSLLWICWTKNSNILIRWWFWCINNYVKSHANSSRLFSLCKHVFIGQEIVVCASI